APIASGAITPVPAPITVHPIVRTRKNVPINSAIYLFMSQFLREADSKTQASSAMGLWSYWLLATPPYTRRPIDTREARFPLVSKKLWKREGLRQATNFIQIKSRMIAPMIDRMKPAG